LRSWGMLTVEPASDALCSDRRFAAVLRGFELHATRTA
jgi:hypothetical protein